MRYLNVVLHLIPTRVRSDLLMTMKYKSSTFVKHFWKNYLSQLVCTLVWVVINGIKVTWFYVRWWVGLYMLARLLLVTAQRRTWVRASDGPNVEIDYKSSTLVNNFKRNDLDPLILTLGWVITPTLSFNHVNVLRNSWC